MYEVQKALDLIVDDHNFSNPGVTMIPEHLELFQFLNVGEKWVAAFSAKAYHGHYVELTYDTKAKSAVIDWFSKTSTSIIEDD